MKKLFLIAGVVALTAFTPRSTELHITGSDTMLPMMRKLTNFYQRKNGNFSFVVKGGGSGVGIDALKKDSTDAAMISRELTTPEEDQLRERRLHYFTVAYDAVAVVINPSNKVHQLNQKQLADIFTGKIHNWKELGGKDLEIEVYTRMSNSGTYSFVKEHVMEGQNFSASAKTCEDTPAIIKAVGQSAGAIGYTGIAYVNEKVKAVSVSFNSSPYTKPSVESALDGTYPITRPLYMVFPQNREKNLLPFMSFLLSEQGRDVIKESGYIPISAEVVLERFLNVIERN